MRIGNRPELYKKTVDILFDAYFNDTLVHNSPCACAVGNMIAANNGFKIVRSTDGKISWDTTLFTSTAWNNAVSDGFPYMYHYKNEAKQQIDSTGYNVFEISRIEYAFECVEYGQCENDYTFNGLVAVLKKLEQIHQVTDDEESIPRFRAHYQRKLIPQ